jgi:hypothetical protein
MRLRSTTTGSRAENSAITEMRAQSGEGSTLTWPPHALLLLQYKTVTGGLELHAACMNIYVFHFRMKCPGT